MHKVMLLLLLSLVCVSGALADVQKAHSAYDRGHYSQAFSMYRDDAEKGDPEAQYALATMYYDGKGIARDLAQAAAWTRKAAENGIADAQMLLGNLYFEGKGVKQDYELAVTWYRRAAEKGLLDAQFNMGYMYEFGFGVPIDCDKAFEWYEKAALQGDGEAQEIMESFSCREYANIALLHGGGSRLQSSQLSAVVRFRLSVRHRNV